MARTKKSKDKKAPPIGLTSFKKEKKKNYNFEEFRKEFDEKVKELISTL